MLIWFRAALIDLQDVIGRSKKHEDYGLLMYLVVSRPSIVGKITKRLRLYKCRKIRPLLNAKGANVAHRLGEPIPVSQRLDSEEQIRHIFVFRHVKTALNPAETVSAEDGANLGVSLGDALWMMLLRLGHHQIEGHGIHSIGLRVIAQVSQAILGLLARLDQGNFNHPVAVVQLMKRPAHFIFRAERPEALYLADGNGRRRGHSVHDSSPLSRFGFMLAQYSQSNGGRILPR